MAVGGKLTWKEFEDNCRKIMDATPAPVNENAADKEARVSRAKKDYAYFMEYYFPMYASAKSAWFHLYVANLLLKKPFLRLLLDWFRGCAKSVHADMGWPLWLKINGEMKCMLLVGENKDKAQWLLADIQAQLQNNQRFINDFGEQFSYGSWESGNFRTKDGCSFFALGIGQSPRGIRNQGARPDYIVVDDVDSEELSHNPKRVRKLVDWIYGALMGTFDGPRQRLVVVNNRPFVHSVMGSMIKEKISEHAERGEKTEFDKSVSSLAKGIKALGAFTYQVKNAWHRLRVNAVDDAFNPAWPEKYTSEYWQMIRADNTHRSWMREYMNTPVVEGTIFKLDQIRWKKALPLDEYDFLIAYADPSWKNTTGSDHKACPLIGKIGQEYHIIKMFNRQSSITGLVCYMYDLYESMDMTHPSRPFRFRITEGVVCQFWIEANMNQDMHLKDFQTEGELRKYQLGIRPDYRAKPDKFGRIESMSPLYERGRVFHNEDEKEDPDMLRHIEHTLAFEQGSKSPDDSLDAQEGGIYYAERATRVSSYEPVAGKRNRGRNRY